MAGFRTKATAFGVMMIVMAMLIGAGTAAPAFAQNAGAQPMSPQPYSQLRIEDGALLPASGGSAGTTLSDMSTNHLMAIGAGIVIAVAAIEMAIDGGAGLSLLAAVGGALVGDWWFREHLWPFD